MGYLSPRIMLIGKNGQIGWELQRSLAPSGEIVALDRDRLDLADADQIRRRVREIKPGIIVNAAAYTAVDRAEEEPELAMAVNGSAPGVLAEEAKHLGAFIIHYSTDYVFSGHRESECQELITSSIGLQKPYVETDKPNPLNIYGQTKLAGERAIEAAGVPHLILRIGWVYGTRGRNFMLSVLRLAREQEELRIVDDQVGVPTWSRLVAEATAQIIAQIFSPVGVRNSLATELSGIYHLSAGGQTTWYGFAREILDRVQHLYPNYGCLAPERLKPIHSHEYPTAARRPSYSKLGSDLVHRTFNIKLPSWQDSLQMALESDLR